jgi:hypothetical protein
MKKVKKENILLLRHSGRELHIFIRQLSKLNWHTYVMEDFLLTSALADFFYNPSQIKHNNITGIIYDYKLL